MEGLISKIGEMKKLNFLLLIRCLREMLAQKEEATIGCKNILDAVSTKFKSYKSVQATFVK
jgi:hypothetical protein